MKFPETSKILNCKYFSKIGNASDSWTYVKTFSPVYRSVCPFPGQDSIFYRLIRLLHQPLSPRRLSSAIDNLDTVASSQLTAYPLDSVPLSDWRISIIAYVQIQGCTTRATVAASLFSIATIIRTLEKWHTIWQIHLYFSSGVDLISIRSLWTLSNIFRETVGLRGPFDLLPAFRSQISHGSMRKMTSSTVTP